MQNILKGMRVVEGSAFVAAPSGGMTLAQLGADVIRFDHGDRTFAVYRSPDDEYYATDGLCTHEDVHLEDGLVSGEEIECPMHMGVFNIKTGKVVMDPPCEDLKTFKVKEENFKIYIEAE